MQVLRAPRDVRAQLQPQGLSERRPGGLGTWHDWPRNQDILKWQEVLPSPQTERPGTQRAHPRLLPPRGTLFSAPSAVWCLTSGTAPSSGKLH